jgi:hypothetical protein
MFQEREISLIFLKCLRYPLITCVTCINFLLFSIMWHRMGNFHYLSIHLSMNQDMFLLCNVQHCVLFAFADTHEILRQQGEVQTFIFILILSVCLVFLFLFPGLFCMSS